MTKAKIVFHIGTFCGIDAILAYCGVGKVNAALCAELMIESFSPDLIISAGTAGALDPSLNVFDTIISDSVFYHDMDEGILTEYHPYLEMESFPASSEIIIVAEKARRISAWPMVIGRIVSGDSFIPAERKAVIREESGAIAVDMESAAIAHVSYANSVPFVAVRTITDTSCEGAEDFDQNVVIASERSADIVAGIFRLAF